MPGEMYMQTHVNIGTDASLLPYLVWNKENPSLRLALTLKDPSDLDKSYPFSILNGSGPAAKLLEAAFVTNGGSVLKRVFLLLQKDRYAFQGDELWQFTNQDIDDIWQQAFTFHAGEIKGAARGTVVLSGKLDANGDLIPLASLFYCRKRDLFFHPPCPKCGRPLQLCRDEALLGSSGLQPYSGSLKRYLYCAPCSASGVGGFYVDELEHGDPLALKDRWSLISEFGSLGQAGEPATHFPCPSCPEHETCYGPGGMVRSRILPFSFYPFFALIFDAMSLNALEFLPLISGATFDELESRLTMRNEAARINCLKGFRREGLSGSFFHTAADDRYFGEVLYLKLSFLYGVLRQLLAQPDILVHPDMRPTIDRVWVDFRNQNRLLPSFWNFTTQVIDIISPPDLTERPSKCPSSNLLFYLGLVWFYALLVNKKQANKEVLPAVKDALAKSCPEFFSGERSNPVLAPENIFWDPDGKSVACNYSPLWEKCLGLGFGLLRSATELDPLWTHEVFFEELDILRTEVKNTVFWESPVGRKDTVQDESLGGEDVSTILAGIMDKWRTRIEVETTPDFVAATQGGTDDPLLETVIISPGMPLADQHAMPTLPVAQQTSETSEEEDIAATVILSASETGQQKK